MVNYSILILAYNFPPEISGGVGRPYSLYKHLHKFGIKPHIVTIDHDDIPHDEKNIFRFDSLRRTKNEGVKNKKIIYRVLNKVLKYFGSDPSIDIYWSLKVKAAIGQIITKNNIKAVYASFPPIQSMKLGLYISQKYNLPLISEFRDGYLLAPLYSHTKMQRFFAKHLERQIINCSSAIITIGNNLTNSYAEYYKSLKVQTVYNGYEKSDFLFATLQPKSVATHKHKFVHFGNLNLSKKRNVQPLFLALSRLKQDGHITNNNFSLTLIGNYTNEEYNYSKTYFLEDIVKYEEPVDKSEGFVDITDNYTELLFYGIEKDPTFISAKLMEYVNLRKPILGICAGNEAENIIDLTKTGITCGFDEQAIYNAFVKFLQNEIEFNPDIEAINQFDREYQAKQISAIIQNVLELN